MHLNINCQEFCNFGANYIHAELLKLVYFVFCMIIMAIPSMICFPSFLNISCHIPWCFRMFPPVFLRFPQVFLLFPLIVSPVSYFGFCSLYFTECRTDWNIHILSYRSKQCRPWIIIAPTIRHLGPTNHLE